ncbi:enoyl-CoA hydratase [Falsibacillus albus]|uniref:Enoyl-CoA hydratase n=1 Tax=Falsibacillus albus TaxID=2478915 RepID=A0A3L7K4W2_9BACI|nr:enoyl-CoA hydratase [Falsibacillus albus]RLQ97309.1 enoyl-CoA hydratase [Falsibacillus albus]
MNLIKSYETIHVEIKEEVAFVTMNRPQQLNALNGLLIQELGSCLKELKNTEEINILVLRGNGPAFSSGGDIKEMLNINQDEQFFDIMDHINELMETLYSMPKLTISCIQGAAAGLGLSIALATDHIVADKTSKIAMNFIGIGLIPDGGGHFLLEKRLGATKAKRVIWDGKIMKAEEAQQLGLVDQLVEESMAVDLENLLSNWRRKPLKAMIKTKMIYAEMELDKLRNYLELEKLSQYEMRQTKDHLEGIKAFVEKRPPIFQGK